MEKEYQTDFWHWVKVGAGLTLGSMLIGSAGALLWLWGLAAVTKYQIDHIETSMQQSVAHFAEGSNPTNVPEKTIHVQGKSKEECLEESKGVADEQYAKCRTGYTYRWSGDGSPPDH